MLEDIPHHDAAKAALDLRERLLAHPDLRMGREGGGRLGDRGVREIDREPAPSFAREIGAHVAAPASDLEKRSPQSVLLDEAIEAIEHVLLERKEVSYSLEDTIHRTCGISPVC